MFSILEQIVEVLDAELMPMGHVYLVVPIVKKQIHLGFWDRVFCDEGTKTPSKIWNSHAVKVANVYCVLIRFIDTLEINHHFKKTVVSFGWW